MQTQPIPPVRLSCLNEYIARLQKELDRNLANDMALLNANRLPPEQKALVRQEVDREVAVMLWEIDTARKYKLTPSALSMIARLKPERGQGVMDPLPGTALWVMLDDPQGTSLFFSCYSHAWSAYRDQHPGILNRYQEERGTQEWYGWTLEVLEPGSVKQRYAYYPRRQQWTMGSDSSNWIVSSGRTPCPSKRCRLLNRNHQENFPNWSICNDCLPDFEYWTSWFPVAYMALNGDFAETEEPQQSTVSKSTLF